MSPNEFESAVELLDEMLQQLYRRYGGNRRRLLRDQLGRLKQLCGERQMPFVRVELGVLDRDRQKAMQIGRVDVTYCDDGELFGTGGETDTRSYVLDDQLVCVPDGQCPACLGVWLLRPRMSEPCPECGIRFGDDFKIVIAGNRCPFCEEEYTECESCGCSFDWNGQYVSSRKI